MTSFSQWIEDKNQDEWWIFIKRLSANDTGLTGGNGVGIYVPKAVVATALPSISSTCFKNPDCSLRAQVSSHGFPEQTLRGIYYNNYHFDGAGSRNEHRLTRWNTDVKNSPAQDPENTGALAIFAFHVPHLDQDSEFLDIWICKGIDEEEFVENKIGEVIPGSSLFERGDRVFAGFAASSDKEPSNVVIPPRWEDRFPSGEEIIAYLASVFRFNKITPDELILERRENEYKLFRQIEELHVLHRVQNGFGSVDEFMQVANSVSNRRKSRSGRSLEIHLEHLFRQFGLKAFSTQCKTEGNKRPDFIFPSCADYHNPAFPVDSLRMLAVKTTCKDRWRQVINEADRVVGVHLFTLQEGVSPHQFEEMNAANVRLVVPKPLHAKYPEAMRSALMTLNDFIEETKSIY
ncbi:type II restriction endonuclease [Pseudomonas siliginis]|uniref:type II restriction endonuclease n=1 Tax=Pseudomonas siliginis TaxID=2842346 RepID=UPI00209332AF|nr:type II restriction endonuclease [Pseudomonas siliginis]UST73197.1 type II restriction endonuclease [Pseudomonas siliginis]